MPQLVHPALSRAVLFDPYRRRHYALVASAAVITLGLLLNATVTATLVSASESDQKAPTSQPFVGALSNEADSSVSAGVDSATGDDPATETFPGEPSARESFTVDVRPPLVYPVGADAHVSSPFGPRPKGCAACSTQHRGVDWNPGYGTPVVSIAGGVVSAVGNPNDAYGVHLLIDHVVNGQAVTSLYAHLQSGSISYRAGDRVRVGDQIGLVGNTGVSTGSHLHFEILLGGGAVNPVPWMAANGAQ